MSKIKSIKKCDNCNNHGLYILELENGTEKHQCTFCNYMSITEVEIKEPETFFYTEKVEIKEPEPQPQPAVKEPVKEVRAPEKKKGKK